MSKHTFQTRFCINAFLGGLMLSTCWAGALAAQTPGGRIAFLSGAQSAPGLYTIAPDGTGLTRISTAGESFSWAPDGCRLAFIRDVTDIYIMDANGFNERLVVDNLGGDPAGDFKPRWSPNGSHLLFYARRPPTGLEDIFVVRADGSDLVNLTNNSRRGLDSRPTWSPDGSKILLESRRMPRGIYIMSADGTNIRRLADGNRPEWSPDGRKITFATSAMDIFVMNGDGTDVINLTQGSIRGVLPSWSPDGRKIAFKSLANDSSALIVINADGSERKRIFGALAFDIMQRSPPSWSPDGAAIVVEGAGTPFSDLYVVSADGSGSRRLTSSGLAFTPVWLPRRTCRSSG